MLVIQEQLCDELTNKSDLTLLKYPEKTAATLRLIHRLELKPDFSLTPVAWDGWRRNLSSVSRRKTKAALLLCVCVYVCVGGCVWS